MKMLLILVSWLQAGPAVQVQAIDSAAACQVAAQTSLRMIAAQAKSNMTSPHGDLTLEKDEKTGDWRLVTGVIGREVARVACVRQD